MQVKRIAECSKRASAILWNFIKLPFVIKIFVLSIFEWPLKTGFTILLLFVLLLYVPSQHFTILLLFGCPNSAEDTFGVTLYK